jgi:hypothetical protein
VKWQITKWKMEKYFPLVMTKAEAVVFVSARVSTRSGSDGIKWFGRVT